MKIENKILLQEVRNDEITFLVTIFIMLKNAILRVLYPMSSHRN